MPIHRADGTVVPDDQLSVTPRTVAPPLPIVPVPVPEPLHDGAVTNAKLADGVVTTEKLAEGAVTGANLAGSASTAVENLSELRARTPSPNVSIVLSGRTTRDDGGGGTFFYDPNDTTTADDGALTIVTGGGKRFKRVYSGPIDVRWFGADPTGVTNSTAAVDAAIAALPDTGGTILFPPGKFACNLAITKPHVVLAGSFQGGSLTGSSVNSGLVPWDTSLPVVQVGNDTGVVPGVQVKNLCIMRNGPNGQGDYGVRIHGGAMHCRMDNVRILAFNKRGLWIENGASNPVAYFGIVNFSIVGSLDSSHEAALYVKAAAGSYIGGVHLTSGTIEASCTAGRAIDVEISQPIDLSNVYVQTNPVGGLGNVLLRGASHICCGNVKIDGDDANAVLVESTYVGATHLIPDFLSGTVTINGKFKFGDGTELARTGKNLVGYEPQLYHPAALGALFFVDNVDTALTDLYFERVANDLQLVAPASAKVRTTAQIASSTGFRSQAASGTNPVAYAEERTYSVTTTDATQTTIGSLTPASDCVVDVVCTFTARKSSGSGTYRSSAKATYEVASGVVTLVGTVDSELDAKTNSSGHAGTIDTSGGDIRARVTGRAAETWRWTCEMAVTVRTTGV